MEKTCLFNNSSRHTRTDRILPPIPNTCPKILRVGITLGTLAIRLVGAKYENQTEVVNVAQQHEVSCRPTLIVVPLCVFLLHNCDNIHRRRSIRRLKNEETN
jgi:hypothetical protein